MYNRYIPQSDGSHRRNPVITPQQPQQVDQLCNRKNLPPEPPPTTCPPPLKENNCQSETAGSFLKGLLPKGLDTGDLLIILLLLLLADNQEQKNSALLTLAIYLFM